ncbi:MAG: class IV adenylate cyclase [Rectinema sp.]
MMQNPEYSHNLEIELKARVQQREEVESRLSSFMHYIGPINKLDEYWEVSNARLGDFGGFRFRVRHELASTTITFKEKTFDGDVEINHEFEFSVNGEPAFKAFIEKMHAHLIYQKQKRGTRWEDGTGLVAEVVEVSSLGLFLEVECIGDSRVTLQQEEAKSRLYKVIDQCGISRSALEPRPYSQLLGY